MGEFKRAFGEGEMNGDANEFGQRRIGRVAVEEVLVPVIDSPVCGRRGREAGEREGGREHMFAEAGVGVFRVEGID